MGRQAHLGLLLFVLAIVAWVGVVRSQIKTFSGNLLLTKVKTVELASYKQRVSDVEEVKQKGEAIQGTLRSVYLAMPKESQIPEALVMIEALGKSSGVVFGTASLGTAAGSQVPVSISFTGKLDSVNRFLDAVHNNVRTAVTKTQTIGSDKSGNLTVTMQLGLVYQGREAVSP